MNTLNLYQFELCPYCHKVKAALEVKGVGFEKVEVNPYSKRELPELDEGTPRKVPVVTLGDGKPVQDSTAILAYLEEQFPDSSLLPTAPEARRKAEEIEAWVDEDLTQLLPAVLYGTWGEAGRAAQVTARTSNFGFVQNLMVRVGGSLIMHQVSKKIVQRLGVDDPHEALEARFDKLEEWLGDQPFLCGDEVSLADVSVHGALTCIDAFPAFSKVRARPVLSAWFDRVQDVREQNRAA